MEDRAKSPSHERTKNISKPRNILIAVIKIDSSMSGKSRLVGCSVTPDWAIYWALGNFLKPLSTINLSKYPTFLGIFCKGVKIYPFSSEIILGNFYRHLAIFFWSHCSPSLRSPSLSHPYGSFHCSSGDRTPSHTLTTYSNAFFVCEYVCEKMSIQYMGPKFELMTFGT